MEKVIRELIKSEPSISQSDVAARLGLSRQRVSQLCQEFGIEMKDARRGRRSKGPIRRADLNHFGHARQRHSPSFIGGACELTVASDLLRRGIAVYRSLTPVGAFDLVADYEGTLFRIEVRAAKRQGEQLIFSRPDLRYDVLALVTPDVTVTYRPIDGCSWPEF